MDFKEFKKNNPIDTDADPSPKPGATRLRLYWTKGPGAAKIKWGISGDFNRCVRHLRKYVTDPKGLCNVYHVAAVGAPPGQGHPGGKDDDIEGIEFKSQFDVATQEAMLYANMLKESSVAEILDIMSNNETETKDNKMELEHKSLGVSGGITETGEEGVIEALVSVTGIKDNVNDIIMPGAYEKTLLTRRPKGVWSHDWAQPIARPDEIKELHPGDPKLPATLSNGEPWPKEAGALYVKMRFNLETQTGKDAYSNVKFFGDDAEFSIGYNVPKGSATIDKATGIRHIKSLELFEFSPVLFGAASNARTLASSVKTLMQDDEEFRKEIKAVIEGTDEPAVVGDNATADQPTDSEAIGTTQTAGVPVVGSEPPVEIVGQTEVTSTEEQVAEIAIADKDPNLQVANSAIVEGDPLKVQEITEAINGAKAFIPKDDSGGDRAASLDVAIQTLDAIRETIKTTPPIGIVVEKIKTLQKAVASIMTDIDIEKAPTATIAGPSNPDAPKSDSASETKSMREAMNQIIAGPFDAGVADELDNGVRALEASIKALDFDAINHNANAVLDDVTYAMQSGVATPEVISDLKALVAAIGEALKNTASSNGATTEKASVPEEEPVAATKTINLDELKSLLAEI